MTHEHVCHGSSSVYILRREAFLQVNRDPELEKNGISTALKNQPILNMALSGKTALICGGAKNLGAQIALELASVGANLALHYNSEKTRASADKLSATLKEKYPNVEVHFYTGDLTSAGPVEKLFSDVLRDFGGIDIVVNTVGMVLKKPFVDITEKEIDTMFAYVDCMSLVVYNYSLTCFHVVSTPKPPS